MPSIPPPPPGGPPRPDSASRRGSRNLPKKFDGFQWGGRSVNIRRKAPLPIARDVGYLAGWGLMAWVILERIFQARQGSAANECGRQVFNARGCWPITEKTYGRQGALREQLTPMLSSSGKMKNCPPASWPRAEAKLCLSSQARRQLTRRPRGAPWGGIALPMGGPGNHRLDRTRARSIPEWLRPFNLAKLSLCQARIAARWPATIADINEIGGQTVFRPNPAIVQDDAESPQRRQACDRTPTPPDAVEFLRGAL